MRNALTWACATVYGKKCIYNRTPMAAEFQITCTTSESRVPRYRFTSAAIADVFNIEESGNLFYH